MHSAPFCFTTLKAPPHWHTLDFIADLHLSPSHPHTLAAWQHYLQTTRANAVFMLGDLFEVWVGDDAADQPDSFEAQCCATLRSAAGHCDLFFMHGNRDFLVGESYLKKCKTQFLNDPTLLEFDHQRWLLSHGDALCLDDLPYMQFRQQVRQPEWQTTFLAQPLAIRRNIAHHLRQSSEARKQASQSYIDLDNNAARQWLQHSQASTLLHGHTHRPAEHHLGTDLQRIVLSDWDLDSVTHTHNTAVHQQAKAFSSPKIRAEIFRLQRSQPWQRLTLDKV